MTRGGSRLTAELNLIFPRYEDVYAKLLTKFKWNRFAALTEDGMKYTQYISSMDENLKEKGISLIVNKKFSRVSDKDRQLENFITVSCLNFLNCCIIKKSPFSYQVSQRAKGESVSRQNHHRRRPRRSVNEVDYVRSKRIVGECGSNFCLFNFIW